MPGPNLIIYNCFEEKKNESDTKPTFFGLALIVKNSFQRRSSQRRQSLTTNLSTGTVSLPDIGVHVELVKKLASVLMALQMAARSQFENATSARSGK